MTNRCISDLCHIYGDCSTIPDFEILDQSAAISPFSAKNKSSWQEGRSAVAYTTLPTRL